MRHFRVPHTLQCDRTFLLHPGDALYVERMTRRPFEPHSNQGSIPDLPITRSRWFAYPPRPDTGMLECYMRVHARYLTRSTSLQVSSLDYRVFGYRANRNINNRTANLAVPTAELNATLEDSRWEGENSPPLCLPIGDTPAMLYFHSVVEADPRPWVKSRFLDYVLLERELLIGLEMARLVETRGFIPVLTKHLAASAVTTWKAFHEVPLSPVVPRTRSVDAKVIVDLLEASYKTTEGIEEISCAIEGVSPEKIIPYSHPSLPFKPAKLTAYSTRDGVVVETPPFRRDGEFADDGYYAEEPASYSDGDLEDYLYKPEREMHVPRPGRSTPAGYRHADPGFSPHPTVPVAPAPYEPGVPQSSVHPPVPRGLVQPTRQGSSSPSEAPFLSPDRRSGQSVDRDGQAGRSTAPVDVLGSVLTSAELFSVTKVRELAETLGDGQLSSVFPPRVSGYPVRGALNTLAMTCITLGTRYKASRERRDAAETRYRAERAGRRLAEEKNSRWEQDAAARQKVFDELQTRVQELEEELRLARRRIPHERGRDTPSALGTPASLQPQGGTSGRRRDRSPSGRDDGRNVRARRSMPVDVDTPLLQLVDTLDPPRADSPSVSDDVDIPSPMAPVPSAPAASRHRPPARLPTSHRDSGRVRPRDTRRSTAQHPTNRSLRPSPSYPSHQRPRPSDNFRR